MCGSFCLSLMDSPHSESFLEKYHEENTRQGRGMTCKGRGFNRVAKEAVSNKVTLE